MRRRVIHWGTGSMGVVGLRAAIEHPDLELAGVIVHGGDKVGLDAGLLCGAKPVGIPATADAAAALTADADAVSYMASGDLRMAEAVDDMCAALAAGKNVVSCSVVPLVYPPAFLPDQVDKLELACRAGGTTCYTSGIDPGFANDVLPLALSGLSRQIESVRVMEIFNYATYPQPAATFDLLGMGRPPEYQAFVFVPGVLTMAWGPVVHQLAAGLGVEVDKIRETSERRVTEHTIEAPVGVIEAGTVGAFRWELQGLIEGEPRVFVEHVTRMHDDLAPDWPQPHITVPPANGGNGGASGRGMYRVIIEGSPSMHCDLELTEDGDHDLGARIAGATRLMNAIPAVCAAEPGLLSALDLPLVTGANLLGRKASPPPDSRLVALR